MTCRSDNAAGAPRALLVEDADAIRDSLAAAYEAAGYDVCALADGADLEQRIDTFRPDIVVLDIMLTGRDGYALAEVVRSRSDAALLFLTARDGLDDRLRGFDLGADDYVTKPFFLSEVLARSQAAMRRLGRVGAVTRVGDLVLDESAAVASRADTMLELTGTEWRLLVFLVANRGRTLSKTQILTQVWGYDSYDPNLVEAFISTLRRKLDTDGERKLIHTVRGIGYKLQPSGVGA